MARAEPLAKRHVGDVVPTTQAAKMTKLQKELEVSAPGVKTLPLQEGSEKRKRANLLHGEESVQKEDGKTDLLGKTGPSAQSWDDFTNLLKREGISSRDMWRSWAKSNQEERKRLKLPFDVEAHFKGSGFPFTSFRELCQVKHRDTKNVHL